MGGRNVAPFLLFPIACVDNPIDNKMQESTAVGLWHSWGRVPIASGPGLFPVNYNLLPTTCLFPFPLFNYRAPADQLAGTGLTPFGIHLAHTRAYISAIFSIG